MIRENGTMVLNATLVDRRNMKCDLVAPVVPIAVPVSREAGDEEMRDSRNVSECEAAQIPVLGGAREVNRSKQPTESERRRHELSHLPHVPWCTICCRARTIDDAHHVVIHEESVDSLPKIVCDYAEIKMKGDTTPMRVLLVVDSSDGYLGATDVDQKGGSSGFPAKWMAKWLESTGYTRMKVQSDAEQSIEHLLKAVKSICTADLFVQRAPVKSHQSQGHVERAVRLVANQYRALLFDVQERTRVASAWILRHAVWLLNRYQPHKGGATSFERLTGSPYRSPIPSDRKPGGVLVVAKGTPRTFRSMWVGRTEESNEHLVVNEVGHVVRARTVRRCVENENSGSDVFKLNATPSYLKPDGDDDGPRRQDAERASRHMQTNTWSDVKHVDTSIV